MIRALYTSASGMNSQQMNLDVIANNLANVNTSGFKKSKIEFQDLLYDMKKIQGAEAGDGQLTPGGIQIGHGSRPVSTSKVFTTGDLVQTDERLDIAIAGAGFFEVQMPGGFQGYTRDGSFKVSADGAVVTNEGYQVVNAIPNIGAEVSNIAISKTGEYTLLTSRGKILERVKSKPHDLLIHQDCKISAVIFIRKLRRRVCQNKAIRVRMALGNWPRVILRCPM